MTLRIVAYVTWFSRSSFFSILECHFRFFTYSAIFLVVMCIHFLIHYSAAKVQKCCLYTIAILWPLIFPQYIYPFISHHFPMLYQHVSFPKHDHWWPQLGSESAGYLGLSPFPVIVSTQTNSFATGIFGKGGTTPKGILLMVQKFGDHQLRYR